MYPIQVYLTLIGGKANKTFAGIQPYIKQYPHQHQTYQRNSNKRWQMKNITQILVEQFFSLGQ